MTSYIALLRAVNVGGTGKLSMAKLKQICESVGFSTVRTYIASGNVVFRSAHSEAQVKKLLEAALGADAGKPIGVMVRTAAQVSEVLAKNPFLAMPGNRTVAIFLDEAPSANVLDSVTGKVDEIVEVGVREIYVFYGEGMGNSKLRIPAAKTGTARNMNTIAKLAQMAAD